MLTFAEIQLSFKNERGNKKFFGIEKVWDYLARRGIDEETASKCDLMVMPAVELISAARRSASVNPADSRVAIVFPHWRSGTDEPIEWWSSRLVALAPKAELRVVTSFSDMADMTALVGTPGKMFCPPNEPPHAYMVPGKLYNWGNLRDGDRVFIHESAIKAINGAVLGLPSVGLNGVWGWGSKKHSIALVQELRDLPWRAKKLQPVIVFDSNAHDNWQVQMAEQQLAAKLLEVTGQHALSIRVPKTENGGDQGFDDYRVQMGDRAGIELLSGEGEVVEIGERQAMMLQLNSEVCVVRELGRIADQATGDLMTRPTFTDVNYAHFNYVEEDGERTRVVNVPKAWLASDRRIEAQSLTYDPGHPRLVRGETGLPNLNLWRGMGLHPASGDVDPWLELLVNNIPDEELRQWFIQWLAYPLQNPGCKMNSFALIFGPSGTGKDMVLSPMHDIYGVNAVTLDTDSIKSQFTSLYSMRQFVHADELVRARGAEDAVSQRIKALVTQPKLKVNKKGQPEYTIDNHTNLVITSNYWDCVKLDSDDRRACVIRWEGVVDRRGDQPYWQAIVNWRMRGGSQALYQYLLDYDMAGFNPSAWAPHTSWKEQVKEAGRGPMEGWVHDLSINPEDMLPLVGVDKCLWTAKELGSLYYNKSENDVTKGEAKAIGGALRNANFKQAHDGALIRKPGGEAARFWVVRRRDAEWSQKACVAHLKLHP